MNNLWSSGWLLSLSTRSHDWMINVSISHRLPVVQHAESRCRWELVCVCLCRCMSYHIRSVECTHHGLSAHMPITTYIGKNFEKKKQTYTGPLTQIAEEWSAAPCFFATHKPRFDSLRVSALSAWWFVLVGRRVEAHIMAIHQDKLWRWGRGFPFYKSFISCALWWTSVADIFGFVCFMCNQNIWVLGACTGSGMHFRPSVVRCSLVTGALMHLIGNTSYGHVYFRL